VPEVNCRCIEWFGHDPPMPLDVQEARQ
jgi:hypothetical protein